MLIDAGKREWNDAPTLAELHSFFLWKGLSSRKAKNKRIDTGLYIGRSSNVIIGSCGNFEEVIKSNQSKIIFLGPRKSLLFLGSVKAFFKGFQICDGQMEK